jgi:hypothetical protein
MLETIGRRTSSARRERDSSPKDTIIVPAHIDGFNEVFLGLDCWYAVRIAPERQEQLKFVAAYLTAPVAAITHYAEVRQIVPYGKEGKFKLVFAGKAKPIGPIAFATAPKSRVGMRYTTLDRLRNAKTFEDLINM